MASRTNWNRKSVIDLYNERDKTSWYWRLLGTLSATLILIGFLIFPVSFASSLPVTSNQSTISIVAVILLALGYSLSVALWFICQSWLFQLDVLFIPCLFSCVAGLINIGITIGSRFPTPWTTPSISALALACASTVIYGTLSVLTFRKISNVRASNHRHRTDSESITLLPEDELQRQQLLRLLLQKEGDKATPSASQNTFRIDIPDNAAASRTTNSYSPAPSSHDAMPTSSNYNDPSSHYNSSNPSHYLAAPTNTYDSSAARGRNIGALPIDEQFALLRGQVAEPPIDRKQAALERARERSQQNSAASQRSQNSAASQRSRGPSPGGPPVIFNSRVLENVEDIPLSERHPLEREGGYIRANRASKEEYRPEGVYRPEDHDPVEEEGFSYSNPSPERALAEFELEERGRRVELRRLREAELEGETAPRDVKVQPDKWSG